MARPGSEWVAVAWFSDQGTASNVADYLEASGVSAYTHAHATRALGSTPVFVLARELELARAKLRRFKTGDFDPDAEDGTADAMGAQLLEDLGAAPDYQPPSRVARLAPLILIPLLFVAWLLALGIYQAIYPREAEPYRETHRVAMDRWR